MKEKQVRDIKSMVRKAMDDFIASIPSRDIQRLFKEQSFVAGGAIASMVLGEKPNDFDFYFKSTEACSQVASYFLKQMNLDLDCDVKKGVNGVVIDVPQGILKAKNSQDESNFKPIVLTANAISFTGGIQVIIRYTGIPSSIIDHFDFLHAKGCYDYKEDRLIIGEDILDAIQKKRLVYTGSDYPLASLIRTRKFIKRGYLVNAGQFLKMSLDINKLNLMDPVVLREQLIGVDLLIFDQFLRMLHEYKKGELDILTQEAGSEFLFALIDEAFGNPDKDGNENE